MTEGRFEKRRRAARWRRARPYVLGVLAAAAVAGAVWALWFSDLLTAERVQVEGITTLSVRSVRQQAQVPMGVQLARIDTGAITIRIARMERIDTVDVSRRWPRTVRIEVAERKPVAWIVSAGQIRQVDRDGIDFRTLASEPTRLVEIRVRTEDPLRRQQAVVAAARVVTYLRANAADIMGAVEYVTAASKDSITLELDGDRTVRWGSVEEADKKRRVLRALLRIDAERYDVSAPEQPTTWKPEKK
ncbi:MAG TPA: FtsQ-type POTRA domain-containing protein [Aeromicrobium sp.]|nr:FtsQ-type POTRA domain-containing protein [Aeromicrobium sp.]